MHATLRRLALFVTYAVSPPVLPPLIVWLLMVWTGSPRAEIAGITLSTLVLLSALPVAFLIWAVRTGRSPSMNLEDRRHRATALAIAVFGGVALAWIVHLVAAPARGLLLATLLAFVLTAAALVLVNRSWRISLHCASIGGFSSVLLFATAAGVGQAPHPSTVLAFCVPALLLVGWSRLYLGAHSVAQVVAGALVGLLVPYSTLSVVNALRPLFET